jgi:hypothetical protein
VTMHFLMQKREVGADLGGKGEFLGNSHRVRG